MMSMAKNPQLPALLSLPLRLLPARLHSALVAVALERIFAEQRADGELDFMQGRTACIKVLDAGIALTVTADSSGFRSWSAQDDPDLSIEGTAYDYLLLITGREDPDTLFFQRRLRMAGDTALGVHLKNFLAATEPEALPFVGLVRPGLLRGMNLVERLLR